MEIIKAFQNNNIGVNITIQGTHIEPLFRASDIGEILDIYNIRQNIQEFDNTEKDAVCLTDSMGRSQEVTFLTEKGLYKILFKSRKPIAKKFTNWVCEVIKEIRLNNVYNLEKQLKEKDKELLEAKENTLLETYKNSRGVYLAYINHDKQVVKFGHGTVGERVTMHKREIGEEFSLQYIIETQYDRELESLIKRKLKNRVFSKKFENRKAMCTELIQLDKDYDIKNLYKDVLKFKKMLKDEVIINLKNKIKDLKLKSGAKEEESELSDFEEVSISELEDDIEKEEEKEIKEKRISHPNLIKKLKKKVYKFKIEGNEAILVKTYDSIGDVAKEENIAPVTLTYRIKRGTNIDGYMWSFEKSIPLEFFSSKSIKVYKLDLDLNVLQIFNSIKEASDKENIVLARMQRVVKNNTNLDGIIYSKIKNPSVKNLPKEGWSANAKKVGKFDKNNNMLETFRCNKDAAKSITVSPNTMVRMIRDKRITTNEEYYKYI